MRGPFPALAREYLPDYLEPSDAGEASYVLHIAAACWRLRQSLNYRELQALMTDVSESHACQWLGWLFVVMPTWTATINRGQIVALNPKEES